MTVLAGVFNVDPDTADLFFVVAWLALWVVGVVAVVQRSLVAGLGLIALGFIPLADLFLTP